MINTAPVPPFARGQLAELEQQLRGDVAQIPPMYSAIKHHGTPLYKLARRGIEVERQPRQIHIDALRLTAQGESALAFSLSCSKGTYVRTLAEQIGASLGTVAHLEALRRTQFGAFSLEQALTLDAVEQRDVPVIGLREALPHLREIRVDEAAAAARPPGLRAGARDDHRRRTGRGGEIGRTNRRAGGGDRFGPLRTVALRPRVHMMVAFWLRPLPVMLTALAVHFRRWQEGSSPHCNA